MMNAEIMEQFRMLKGLTIRFGCLHEAQVQQLKMYPKLIEGVESSTASVDIQHRSISFKCTGKKIRKTKRRVQELSAITEWVRTILWDDAQVIFEMNGSIIYDSKFDRAPAADSE